MSPLEAAGLVSYLVACAVFGIAVGVLGGVMTFRALKRRGATDWTAGPSAILAGILTFAGGWLVVLLPYFLVRGARWLFHAWRKSGRAGATGV
jgi:hypothetical protein